MVAAATFLASQDVIGIERAADMMSALLGADVSTGFVSRCVARLDQALLAARFEDTLKNALCQAEVLGTDETPAPITASGAAAETARTGQDVSSPHVFTVRTMRSCTTGGPDLVWFGAAGTENRRQAGVTNVEFLKGYIEDIPLPANTVDVAISNCVINLSTDKPRVLAEMHRVLRPGGRIGIADIVADNDLSPADRAARGSYVGCIAGALSFAEYEAGLRDAGFTDISVAPRHQAAPGMQSAIIKATKPTSLEGEQGPRASRRQLPVLQSSCC